MLVRLIRGQSKLFSNVVSSVLISSKSLIRQYLLPDIVENILVVFHNPFGGNKARKFT